MSYTGRVNHGRLDTNIPSSLPDELITRLAGGAGVRVERIVSRGHASPDGFWYDQDEDEFVLLVRGAARLQLEGAQREISLGAGDWVELPAHVRHRVSWTDPSCDTIWLAVFYPAARDPLRAPGEQGT